MDFFRNAAPAGVSALAATMRCILAYSKARRCDLRGMEVFSEGVGVGRGGADWRCRGDMLGGFRGGLDGRLDG